MEEMVDLPGFRFHPTEEELVDFYLKNMVYGKKLRYDHIIGYLNIYHHDPCELPGLARNGEREWYFFVPRDRRHGSGGRPNRTTANGFWKATGSDRRILGHKDPKKIIGLRKTLVFYKGRAPRGTKTDWVMNEYRLPDSSPLPKAKDIVLCKIYRKATSLKVLEQRAAMEEDMIMKSTMIHHNSQSPISSLENMSFSTQQHQQEEDSSITPISLNHHHPIFFKEELIEDSNLDKLPINTSTTTSNDDQNDKPKPTMDFISASSSLQLPTGNQMFELQVPKFNMDWNQDNNFWLNSPWLQNLTQILTTPTTYANILNF